MDAAPDAPRAPVGAILERIDEHIEQCAGHARIKPSVYSDLVEPGRGQQADADLQRYRELGRRVGASPGITRVHGGSERPAQARLSDGRCLL